MVLVLVVSLRCRFGCLCHDVAVAVVFWCVVVVERGGEKGGGVVVERCGGGERALASS